MTEIRGEGAVPPERPIEGEWMTRSLATRPAIGVPREAAAGAGKELSTMYRRQRSKRSPRSYSVGRAKLDATVQAALKAHASP